MLSAFPLKDVENAPTTIKKSTSHLATKSGHKQTRRPLSDLSNGATDNAYQPMDSMETALRETLVENRRVHELCETLRGENIELRGRVGELAVVTMLYEVAKAEIEELTKKLAQLSPLDTENDNSALSNSDL
ncbi:hypothetical protein PSACC_03385 [Paramicrosporidium saccamoebae]|uniref:Uncharacterized protein n=1 Tax=Paramicrosporidium saccamoebae TaxID=1246581 RepID=A0A2H9TGQ8_9FUNG|nr:hypothetical protein PSACC_03385 [Paramicrosporidium saccamoebae]